MIRPLFFYVSVGVFANLISCKNRESSLLQEDKSSVVRLFLELTPTEGEVQFGSFSPDAKFILLCTADRGNNARFYVYDAATGEKLREFAIAQDFVTSIDFSADSKTLAVATKYSGVRLYDSETWKYLNTIYPDKRDRSAVKFSRKGSKLAIHYPGELSLWDIGTSKLIRRIATSVSVGSIDFSPDDQKIIAASAGGVPRIMLWNVVTGKEIDMDWPSLVEDAGFSPDGKSIFVIHSIYDSQRNGHRGVAKILDSTSGKEISSLNSNDSMGFGIFSPDGKSVLINTFHSAQLWDLATQKIVRTFDTRSLFPKAYLRDMSFRNDGLYVLLSVQPNTAAVFTVGSLYETVLNYYSALALNTENSKVVNELRTLLKGTVKSDAISKEEALKLLKEANLDEADPAVREIIEKIYQ